MLEAVEVIRGFLTVRGLVSLHSVLFKGKLYFKISETQPRKKKIKIIIILPSREKHSIWASSMSVFPSYISLLFNQQTLSTEFGTSQLLRAKNRLEVVSVVSQ